MKMTNLFRQTLTSFFNTSRLEHMLQRLFDLPDIVKWIKQGRHSSILELGCANGYNTYYLSRKIKSRSYLALDKDPHQIAQTEARCDGLAHVVCQVGDVCHLPVESGQFDVVVCVDLLHHIVNWKKALGEMNRVLKKGGRLVLKEFTIETFTIPGLGSVLQELFQHPYDQMFDQVELLSFIRKAGFEVFYQNDSLRSILVVATKTGKSNDE